jgi:hypothetical protein
MNYRATWLGRLLGIATSGALLGVAIAAAYFAGIVLIPTENISRQRNAGDIFQVVFPNTIDETQSLEERIRLNNLWYGNFYELPPGVREGGLEAILTAGIICAVVGGMGLIGSLIVSHEVTLIQLQSFYASC